MKELIYKYFITITSLDRTKMETSLIRNRNKVGTFEAALRAFTRSNWNAIIDYLDDQSLGNFIRVLARLKDAGVLARLCQVKLAFRKIFNKVDRSYYFSLYELTPYKQYEANRVSCLADSQLAQQFCNLPTELGNVLAQVQQCVSEPLKEEFGQKLQQLFIDPYLPMPKLTRETVTSKANSPFQFFLLEQSNEDQPFQILEQIFQQVQSHFQQHEQSYMLQLLKHPQISSQLRHNAHTITYKNYKTKLIPGNKLHNFIVSLFAAMELMLSKVDIYLGSIGDGFQSLVEITMRYTQFMNTVLGVEENLGAIFRGYGDIYEEVYGNGNKNSKFSFYKPAMTMWLTKMQVHHEKTLPSYIHLLHKCHSQQTFTNIASPQFLSKLSLLIEPSSEPSTQVYSLLAQEPNALRILLKLYEEYLMDCSLDQISVHFCGYSLQKLGCVYEDGEKEFLQAEGKVIERIRAENWRDEEKLLVQEYLQERLHTFEDLLRPRTLKACINMYMAQSETIMKTIKSCDEEFKKYIDFLVTYKGYRIVNTDEKAKQAEEPENDKEMTESTDFGSEESRNAFQFYDSEDEMDIEIESA